jgi:hypothetical protein
MGSFPVSVRVNIADRMPFHDTSYVCIIERTRLAKAKELLVERLASSSELLSHVTGL